MRQLIGLLIVVAALANIVMGFIYDDPTNVRINYCLLAAVAFSGLLLPTGDQRAALRRWFGRARHLGKIIWLDGAGHLVGLAVCLPLAAFFSSRDGCAPLVVMGYALALANGYCLCLILRAHIYHEDRMDAIIGEYSEGARVMAEAAAVVQAPTAKHLTRGGKCQVCGEEMNEAVICRSCLTPHHGDCWAYNGGCAIYGCGNHARIVS